MGMLGNLKCKCGNTHKTHGGWISVDGIFTCEVCIKKRRIDSSLLELWDNPEDAKWDKNQSSLTHKRIG